MSLQRTRFEPEEILSHQEGNRTHLTIKYDVGAKNLAKDLARNIGKFGWDWLDVGCRTGHFMNGVLEAGVLGRVAGIDIVPFYIEECQDQGLDAVLGDAHELPYPDNSFDLVHSSHCLEHCRDPHQVAQEILRVAREFVMITVPLENAEIANRDIGHYWFSQDPLDWAGLFQHPDWRVLLITANPVEVSIFITPLEKIALWRNRPVSLPLL